VAVLPARGLLVYDDVTLRADWEIEAKTVARERPISPRPKSGKPSERSAAF
jgi:hypothetical protein